MNTFGLDGASRDLYLVGNECSEDKEVQMVLEKGFNSISRPFGPRACGISGVAGVDGEFPFAV